MGHIKVMFSMNGYNVEVVSDAADLELDIVEARNVISKLPATVPPQSGNTVVVPPAAPAAAAAAAPAEAARPWEVVPVTDFKQDKTKSGVSYWKMFGGKYSTFGVALYPDSCRFNDDLNAQNFHIRVGEGLEALVQKVGSSMKVTALRLAAKNAEA